MTDRSEVNRVIEYRQLFDLIQKRNVAEVKRFVKRKRIAFDKNDRFQSPSEKYYCYVAYNPLRGAALVDAPDILKYLISVGFDPHGNHIPRGERPIHSACKVCSDGYVSKTDRKDKQARAADNFEVVRTLVVDHEVHVNVVDETDQGNTPLLQAANEGRLNVVKLLIDEGANIKQRNSYGDTVLHCAARSGCPDLCEFLCSLGLKVDSINEPRKVPLYYALAYDKAEAAEELLKAGADVNWKDGYGDSHLQRAFKRGNLAMIRLLCSWGASIEQEEGTDSLLHQAIKQESYDIVRCLVVENGALLNTRDAYQKTSFYLAMKTGNMKIAELLIACGCKVDTDICVLDEIPSTMTAKCRSEWESFLKDIQEMSENPRKLRDLCCLSIRSLLGKNIVKSVDAFKIPNFLKNVLLMNDLKPDHPVVTSMKKDVEL